jgi:hypothetical protein
MELRRFEAWTLAWLAGCVVITASADGVGAADSPGLRQVATIPLPGVAGRFDHFALDAAGHRLFVAALGNNTVEVMDVERIASLGHIIGMREPQGVWYLPTDKRLFVASGGDGRCLIYDDALKLVGDIAGLDDADNVRFDAAADRVYVGYGGGALAVIDPKTAKRVAGVPLKGHPESFRLEPGGPRVFVNVPGPGHIAVVDRTKGAVVATWPITEARSNFPMFLDAGHGRVLIATMLVLDAKDGRLVTQLDGCGDTDDLFYDAKRRRIYLSGGEGCIDLFDQVDADHYRLHGRVRTAAGARTCYFAREFDRLYLAVPHRGDQRAEVRVFAPEP